MFSKFNEFNKVLFKYDLRENKKKTKKKMDNIYEF